jgi:alginate O-acetyltransferase complex protein AlgF
MAAALNPPSAQGIGPARKQTVMQRLGQYSRALTWAWAGLVASAHAAPEAALYPTGPSRVSGYVRFVNAAAHPVAITTASSGQPVNLAPTDGQRISPFYAVPVDGTHKARFQVQGAKNEIALKVAADEFVTVSVYADASFTVTRELPEDFNALKARIAFFNVSPACGKATLRVRANGASIFKDVSTGAFAQRLVNPVQAQLDAVCGADTGVAVDAIDFGMLAAAKRYSLFLIPDGSRGHHLIGTEDKKATR